MNIYKKLIIFSLACFLLFQGDIISVDSGIDVYFIPRQRKEFKKVLDKHFNELKSGDKLFIASYCISDSCFVNKLIELRKSGIEIRIIYDGTTNSAKSLTKKLLQNDIVPAVWNFLDGKRGLMHNKFILFKNYAITGSANYTAQVLNSSGSKRNYENVLIINSEEISKLYQDQFLEIERNIFRSYIANIIDANLGVKELPDWFVLLIKNQYSKNDRFRQFIDHLSADKSEIVKNYIKFLLNDNVL